MYQKTVDKFNRGDYKTPEDFKKPLKSILKKTSSMKAKKRVSFYSRVEKAGRFDFSDPLIMKDVVSEYQLYELREGKISNHSISVIKDVWSGNLSVSFWLLYR